jgi:hypothetical protein
VRAYPPGEERSVMRDRHRLIPAARPIEAEDVLIAGSQLQ